MKIIHKYVLREHLGPLLFAASALTSLMLLNYIAKQLANLVGKGLPWHVIAEFFVLALPFTFAMTLPMAVLVAVLFVFSRLAAENEITAMKANGISMRRLVLPVLLAGAFFSLAMIAFNDRLLPATNHRLRTLQGDIARKKPTFAIREQVINELSPQEFFLRTNHLDPVTNKMKDVTIYDLSDPLRRHTIYADSGLMAFAENGRDLSLTLYNGFIQEVPKEEPTKLQRLYYKVDQIRVQGVANVLERDSTDTYRSDREMSVCELQAGVAGAEQDFFRARSRFDRAAEVAKKNPGASVAAGSAIPSTITEGRPKRARVNSLGRTYCDMVYTLDTVAVPWIRKRLQRVALGIAPTAAWAQGTQDTARARLDSVRRADSAKAVRRADSLRLAQLAESTKSARPDSAQKDSAAQPVAGVVGGIQNPAIPGLVITPKGDTIYPGVSAGPPVTLPNATGGDSAAGLPVAPSAGTTVPASVEMESARSEMIRWRAQINQFAVEIHKKFAISTACVVFVLLGAPLALRFPRGGVGLVIGVSLIVFALYYVGLIAGESLSDRDILSPALSMWAANIVFSLVGLFLFWRMERDGGNARGSEPTDWGAVLRALGRRLTFRRG